MDLADNDLLDLLLARREPEGELDTERCRDKCWRCCAAANAHHQTFESRPQKETNMKPVRQQSHPVVLQRQPQRRTADLQGQIGPDVIDIRKLYAQTGMFTYDPGFLSTASCQSAITYIDGDKGELLYRGYPIEQLATQLRLPRNLLPAAVRRAAQRRRRRRTSPSA